MEVISQTTQTEVKDAIVAMDWTTMRTYGRLLEPIVHSLSLAQRISAEERATASTMMGSIFGEHIKQLSGCNVSEPALR
jgi:hypothetical protein